MHINEWVKYVKGEPGLIGNDGLLETEPNKDGIVQVRFFNYKETIPCKYENLFLLKTSEEVRVLGGEFLERRFNKLLQNLYVPSLDFIYGRYSDYTIQAITK